jgi:carboxylesterase
MTPETPEQIQQFETFYQGNTGHAVILLPGLCGSEMEMGPIPRLVKQSGHTLIIPRIPGYSAHTDIAPFNSWIDYVDVLIEGTLETHETISLVGLSMGATLALATAERNQNIQSLILLAPVLAFDGWAVPWYHPLLSLAYKIGFRNWHHKESHPYGVKNLELRRRIEKAVKENTISELGAAHLPAKHLYQSLELVANTNKYLSLVHADLLIIHAIDDETASPKNPDLILHNVSSEMRRVIWLGNCYHMITVDNEKEIVANETMNFINQTIEKSKLTDRLASEAHGLVIKNRPAK